MLESIKCLFVQGLEQNANLRDFIYFSFVDRFSSPHLSIPCKWDMAIMP